MHIRVGFLFRDGGADSGKDTHVIAPTDPASLAPDATRAEATKAGTQVGVSASLGGASVWDKMDSWIEQGNADNPVRVHTR